MSDDADEVLAAANALVHAFGSHDTGTYFAAFAADASFVFHTEPGPPLIRDRYRALWASWESDGFHVDECVSSDAQVQLVGPGTAVFTHRVRTVVGEGAPLYERETIVFRREADARWLAVHEHLSPDPGAPGEDAQDGGHA